jgi:hypothetical protein
VAGVDAMVVDVVGLREGAAQWEKGWGWGYVKVEVGHQEHQPGVVMGPGREVRPKQVCWSPAGLVAGPCQ